MLLPSLIRAIINGGSSYHHSFGTKKERSPIITKNVHFVGLDIACDDFAASIYQSPKQSIITKEGIRNTLDGFNMFISWLKEHSLGKTNCIICMEVTGVYNEVKCHYRIFDKTTSMSYLSS